MKSDDVIGEQLGVDGVGSRLEMHLAAILAELRLLTAKTREDTREKRSGGEWKFVAIVVDRLCFYVFTVFFGIATVVVFRHQLF